MPEMYIVLKRDGTYQQFKHISLSDVRKLILPRHVVKLLECRVNVWHEVKKKV